MFSSSAAFERIAAGGVVVAIRARVGAALEFLLLDPDFAGRIARRDLELEVSAVRFDDLAVDGEIEGVNRRRDDARRAPMAGVLECVAQLHGLVARLGAADFRVDAPLVHQRRVVLDLGRYARVEDVHADVEQLLFRNLDRRLRRLHDGHGPRLLDAAGGEHRARENHAQC
jgi:hypothetical protein